MSVFATAVIHHKKHLTRTGLLRLRVVLQRRTTRTHHRRHLEIKRMHITRRRMRQRMPTPLAQPRLVQRQRLSQEQIHLAPLRRLPQPPQELRRHTLLAGDPQTRNRQMLLGEREGRSEKGAVTPAPIFARCNAVYSGNQATSPIVSRNSKCCAPFMSEFSHTCAST